MGTFKLCLINGVLMLPHLKHTTVFNEELNQFQFYGNSNQIDLEAKQFQLENPHLRLDFLRMHKYRIGDDIMGFIPVVLALEMEAEYYAELSRIY